MARLLSLFEIPLKQIEAAEKESQLGTTRDNWLQAKSAIRHKFCGVEFQCAISRGAQQCTSACCFCIFFIGILMVVIKVAVVPSAKDLSAEEAALDSHYASTGGGLDNTWVAKGFTVTGQTFLDVDTTGHFVRCCSDFAAPGWMKEDGCLVYHESSDPDEEDGADWDCSNGQTTLGLTWQEANDFCAWKAGPYYSRLCTKEEVEGGCVKRDGCGYDTELVWTCTTEDGECNYNTNGVCSIIDCTKCINGKTWSDILIDTYGDGYGKAIWGALNNVTAGQGAAAVMQLASTLTDTQLAEQCCEGTEDCAKEAELYGTGVLFILIGLPLCIICGFFAKADDSMAIEPEG
jgi:hypothetical protein